MDETECAVHSLIADCAVLAGGRTLLVRYADANRYDHQAGWFVPDDEVRYLEHPEAAARRILLEQVGIEAPSVHLSHIESFRGNNRTWHLAFHYVADLGHEPVAKPSPDVATTRWFPLDDLPPASEVAHHGWARQILEAIVGSPS
jgi:ADP-ribose pyrophosphatase YjhB (NUDIX family)